MSIRDQKLLYHLTALNNLESILKNNLLPRSDILDFDDVAEPDIISFRQNNGLNQYVPFHFFAKNPFDGRVQKDNKGKDFIYICVSREFARTNLFKIIPLHPKSMNPLQLLDYEEGIEQIDWTVMNTRKYLDDYCRHVCMAESLSPKKIHPADFHMIFTPNSEVANHVKIKCDSVIGRLPCTVTTNRYMFV